jgi:isoleucyl-tRNA synthetase
MGTVMASYKQGQWKLNEDGTLEIAGKTLAKDLFEVRLDMKENVSGQAFFGNKAVVTLDTNVTEELKREGMARDFVRLVQTLRRDKDFNISDRIELCWKTDDKDLAQALNDNKDYIAEQVLAVKVTQDCGNGTEGDIEGSKIFFDAKVSAEMKKGA